MTFLAALIATTLTLTSFVISGVERRAGNHKSADFFLAASVLNGLVLFAYAIAEALQVAA